MKGKSHMHDQTTGQTNCGGKTIDNINKLQDPNLFLAFQIALSPSSTVTPTPKRALRLKKSNLATFTATHDTWLTFSKHIT